MTFEISPQLGAMRIEVAFGEHREDKNWVNWPLTVEALIKRLSKFRRGAKDGASLTQGPVVGGRRQWKNMARNYILMVDCDTGESLDEIEAKIRAHDLAALLWTTYSHNKPASHVPESKFLTWARKNKVDVASSNVVLVAQMKRYLQSTGKVKPSILDSITHVDRELAEGGMRYVVHHDPLPRARALFILNEPFDFTQGGSQESRAAEWKEKYAGLCKTLGLAYDKSCVDPSRLMYLPVIANDADESQHEIRWIDGGALDMNVVPRADEIPDDDPLSAFTNVQAASGRLELKTPGLAAFLKKYGSEFDAAEFLRMVAFDDIRSDTDGKVECMCPNDDAHSNAGDLDDRAFFATDASIGDGWTMHCQHDSCIAAASEHNASGKPDRAWFLDLACQKYGVKHADELVAFTASVYNGENQVSEPSNAPEDPFTLIRREVEAYPDDVDVNAVENTLRRLAEQPPSLHHEHILRLISERTSFSLAGLRTSLQGFVRARRTAEATEGDNSVSGDRPDRPVPAEGEPSNNATTIWAHWPHKDQIRVAKAAYATQNKKSPSIYRKEEGGLVRVCAIDGEVFLEDAGEGRLVWESELNRTLEFKRATDMGEEQTPPFGPVINEFTGCNDLDLPIITGVSNVPMFDKKGKLVVTPGYNEGTRTYLKTTEEFLPVSPVPTEGEVKAAWDMLMQPLRDFPFTDSFTGLDDLPIRDGALDEDGFPLPNWNRGYVSRLHSVAMILQPFMRHLIDGSCPIYHVDKSAPGTGAGFLTDITQIILTGDRAEPGTMNHNPEEFRKEIMASLRRGGHTIFIDNINKHVDDEGLAAAITAGRWRGRILGRSEEVTIPIRQTWIMAGNNLSFSGELTRRVCPIRMDANCPNPAADRPKSYYKYPDVREWAKKNRVKLVHACHTLIQNWIAKDRPSGAKYFSTFHEWSQAMSGVLEAAGYHGFMDTWDSYFSNKNEEGSNLEAFAEHLFAKFNDSTWTVKEAYETGLETSSSGGLAAFGNQQPTWRFPEIPVMGRDEHARATSLGMFMKQQMEGKSFRMEGGKVWKLSRMPVKRKTFYKFVPAAV